MVHSIRVVEPNLRVSFFFKKIGYVSIFRKKGTCGKVWFLMLLASSCLYVITCVAT